MNETHLVEVGDEKLEPVGPNVDDSWVTGYRRKGAGPSEADFFNG